MGLLVTVYNILLTIYNVLGLVNKLPIPFVKLGDLLQIVYVLHIIFLVFRVFLLLYSTLNLLCLPDYLSSSGYCASGILDLTLYASIFVLAIGYSIIMWLYNNFRELYYMVFCTGFQDQCDDIMQWAKGKAITLLSKELREIAEKFWPKFVDFVKEQTPDDIEVKIADLYNKSLLPIKEYVLLHFLEWQNKIIHYVDNVCTEWIAWGLRWIEYLTSLWQQAQGSWFWKTTQHAGALFVEWLKYAYINHPGTLAAFLLILFLLYYYHSIIKPRLDQENDEGQDDDDDI
jgi:hypothetical protein